MTENFLSTEQVAQKLNLKDVRSVRRLIRIGDLPGIFVGKSYRIPESELLRWMDAHKIRRQP
jgi:excisionase family DNA binding protein